MTDAPDMAAWHAKNAAEMIAAAVRELVERDGYRAEQAVGLAILAGLFFDPASVPHAMRRLALTIESVLSDGARVAAMVRFDQLAWIAVAMERELALGDATECVRARLILERSEITAELTEMIRADLLAHVLVEPAAGGMARATLRLAPEVSLYPLDTVAERLVRHLAKTAPRPATVTPLKPGRGGTAMARPRCNPNTVCSV
jgi:hypothetical protein